MPAEVEAKSPPIARYLIPLQVLVLAIYIWYFTTGLWVRLPSTFSTDLYDQLSTAFNEGHLYLDRLPAPDLLALPDPYAIQQRKNVSSYIGDATLFNGRYYLYWGPVPALLLSVVKSLGYARPIGDEYLVVVFTAAVFLLLSSLTASIWRRRFSDLPRWTLLCAIPLIGFITPFLWIINHPLIYEAAVASAEFFFLAGVSLVYFALGGRQRLAPLLLPAGIFWGLAIGCQFTQVVGVAVVAVLTTLWLWHPSTSQAAGRRFQLLWVYLWVPIILGLLGLAWYNRSRFGSVLEFGYRYQLAVVNLHEHYNEIFSPAYIIPNLYNYLLNPFQLTRDFPFLHPQFGNVLSALPLRLPRIYYTEAITGLLYSAPSVVLAAIPFVGLLRRLREQGPRIWVAETIRDPLSWLLLSLIAAGVVEMGVLLFFYYSAPRYLMAVVPALLPPAVIGFWQGLKALDSNRSAARYYCAAAIVLACCSILVSALLAISSSEDRFLEGNPLLMQQINLFFSH